MDLNDEQKRHRKLCGHIHLALMNGDKVELANWYNKYAFDECYLFLIVEKSQKAFLCNSCLQKIPAGSKYLGGHDWHHNWPKICKACALEIFANHRLRHVDMETYPEPCSTLRVYTIQELMFE